MEKKPIIGISITVIAILLVANVSISIAQEPEIFFKDIQIIPGTVQKTDMWTVIFSVCVDGPGDGVDQVFDPRILVSSDIEKRPMQLINVFHAWRSQLIEILYRLDMRDIRQLVGRADCLRHLDYEDNNP